MDLNKFKDLDKKTWECKSKCLELSDLGKFNEYSKYFIEFNQLLSARDKAAFELNII